MFQLFSLHLFTDEDHVTIISCNHLQLITKLSSLDFTEYTHIYVYGHTNGVDNPNEYTQLLEILNQYSNSDCLESIIKISYC